MESQAGIIAGKTGIRFGLHFVFGRIVPRVESSNGTRVLVARVGCSATAVINVQRRTAARVRGTAGFDKANFVVGRALSAVMAGKESGVRVGNGFGIVTHNGIRRGLALVVGEQSAFRIGRQRLVAALNRIKHPQIQRARV